MRHVLELFSEREMDVIRECYELSEDESIVEYFELTGGIFIGTDGYMEPDEFDDYNYFYMGPVYEENGLSDSIYIDVYVESVCKKLGFQIEVGVSENQHGIMAACKSDLSDKINMIIRFVETDGFEVYRDLNL